MAKSPLLGLANEEDTITSYLPYFYYYEEGGYFLNIDGSISVMYELYSPNKIYDKAQEDVLNGLVTFFNHFYKNTVIQVMLNTTRGVQSYNPTVQRYLSIKPRDNVPHVVEECIGQKIKMFEKKQLFKDESTNAYYSAKSINKLFAITVIPEKPNISGGILDTLFGRPSKDNIKRYADEQIKNLNNVIKIAMDAFGIVGIRSKKVDAGRFLDILYPVLNGGEHRREREYSDLIPLREQLCSSPIEIKDNRILINNKSYNIVFVNSINYTENDIFFREDINGVSLIDQLGDFFATLNIYSTTVDNDLFLLSLKRKFSASFSKKKGDTDIQADTIRQEIDNVIKDISLNGKTLPNLTMSFLVESNETDRLINTLSLKGIGCFKEEDPMLFTMFLESMPFFYRKEHESIIQRRRKVYPEHLADIIPLYPSFQGSETGKTHIYLDRRGNPVILDLFKSTTSAHTVVLGKTGAGKSVFMNDFILQANREFCYTLVIDKGNSYQRNCQLFNGKYIVLNPNNPTTINPFFNFDPNNKDKLIFISSLLTFMAVGLNEKDYLTREKRGVLERAITEIADEIKDREITLSDFTEFLGRYGEIGEELSRRIYPFTKKGRYGAFFDGENQFEIDNPFTVFEIGNVNDDELLTAWFMTTAYFYAQKIQSKELIGVSKYLIMDEVWRLMSMESAIGFFLEIVKTYRKYGAGLITITQDFEDFFANRAGVAIFNNSPIKLLLQNSSNSIMANKDKLLLTEWEIEQYLSIKKTRNYSEIFAKLGDETSGIIRLTLTPQIYWVSTTDDKDKLILNKYIDKYGSLEIAIEKIIEELGGEKE